MKILNCEIDKGSVYAKLSVSANEIKSAGSVQDAVKAAIAAFSEEKGLPSLIYTRVTAMDENGSATEVTFEGAVPPQVILGPYKGIEVDIGHCEDFEEAAVQAAAKNLRVAVPELMIRRKIDSVMLEKESELIDSLSLNTLADIHSILGELNSEFGLGLGEKELWEKSMKAAENYIGMGMQDIYAFTQAFDGIIELDGEQIARAAEKRAYARAELPAEQIAAEVFDAYLCTEGKTLDQWREEQREAALTMSRIDFLLAAVADEEGLTVEQDELDRAVYNLAAQYQMPVEAVLNAVGEEAIRHHIRMTKANQIIVDNARNK